MAPAPWGVCGEMMRAGHWYFSLWSGSYGQEEFGAYPTRKEALKAIVRIQHRANRRRDGILRWYTQPVQRQPHRKVG